MTEQKQSGWVEEFDRLMPEDWTEHGVSRIGMKAFIASTLEDELKKQREDIRQTLEYAFVNSKDVRTSAGIAEAIVIINEMTGGKE